MRKPIRSLTLVAVCLLGGAACGKAADKPSGAAPATTTVVTQLPAATGPSVLEISGAKSAPVKVDFETLDRLAKKSYTVFEPFEEKNVTFKGVELWTVLQGAGVPADATQVQLTALDDYSVKVSVADLKKGGVILATQAGGKPMSVDHGGPTRLVFAEGSKAGSNPDQWIWSISKIDVR